MPHLGAVSESREGHEGPGRFNGQSSTATTGGNRPEITERAAGLERGKHNYQK